MEPDTPPRCYRCGAAMTFATRVGPIQSVYRCETCKVEAWVPAYVEAPIAPSLPEPQPQPTMDEV